MREVEAVDEYANEAMRVIRPHVMAHRVGRKEQPQASLVSDMPHKPASLSPVLGAAAEFSDGLDRFRSIAGSLYSNNAGRLPG